MKRSMKRSSQIIASLLIALLMLALCGCDSKTDVTLVTSPDKLAESDLAYKGEIYIASACRHDPRYGDTVNAQADVYNELMDIWKDKHPAIKVKSEYLSAGEIVGLARMEEFPDIVLTDAQTAGVLFKNNKVASIDRALVENGNTLRSEDIDIDTYTRYGDLYGFPALCDSYAVVMYDSEAVDGFPATLKDLRTQGKEAKEQDYDALLAWAGLDGGNAVYSMLSPQFALQKGSDAWLKSMSEGSKELMMTDAVMQSAITRACAVMSSGIFSDESSEMEPKDAIDAFIDHKYPALFTSGTDVYNALEQVKERAPDLYDRLEFAALPVSNDPGRIVVPCGTSNCLMISAEAVSDKDKVQACVDLCQYLTGKAYADEMAAAYGMNTYITADDKAYEKFRSSYDDEVMLKLAKYARNIKPCEGLSLQLRNEVWSECSKGMSEIASAKKGDDHVSVEEITNTMQDNYERYYPRKEAEE